MKCSFLRSQRGVTLVEALVALLVLSIGLLGVAGLQMAAMRNNQGAQLRSQATVLAYDMADRMRANRNAAIAGQYNVALAGSISGTTLNAVDMQQWKQTLLDTLPSGDGAVNVNTTTRVASITVTWTDRFGNETFQTFTQL